MEMTALIPLLCMTVVIALVPNGVENFDVQTSFETTTVRGNKKFIPELARYIDVYLGVQYAEAPIGDLRYKPPQPFQNNTLGRDSFAPSCPQLEMKTLEGLVGAEIWRIPPSVDEDCLYLNIWKPRDADSTSEKKPVIFWIHGGAFMLGSSSIPLYNGEYLAVRTDAVVVSAQYRLGALGFLYTGDDFAPGNVGLEDQVLALEWVYRNIEHFGGDRDKITIVGESAGSVSVGFHVLSPETRKLFKRAILMSGTPNSGWAVYGPDEAWLNTLEFAKKLGADVDDYEDVKKFLKSATWEEIVRGQGDESSLRMMFKPTVAPPVVPERPQKMLEKANHLNGTEMWVSWTKDEGSIILLFELIRLNKLKSLSEDPVILQEDFWKIMYTYAGDVDDDKKQMLLKIYNETGETSRLEALIKYYNDAFMICSINQFVEEARYRGAKVYHAEYNYRAPSTPWPEWMGVLHGSDLVMFFGLPIHQRNFTETDTRVNKAFMDRIKGFVYNGSPNMPNEPSWSEDQVFVISDADKEYDSRANVCNKLKELTPNNASSANIVGSDVLGVLVFLLLSMGM